MSENQEEKIIETLINSPLSSYYIAKKTGISAQSIINYRNKSTKPTAANIKLLEYFFKDEYSINNTINSGNGNQIINANGSVTADNRQFYSDSPDVLRAQIEVLDERIKEKDAQIKEKYAQIKDLHALLNEMIKKQ